MEVTVHKFNGLCVSDVRSYLWCQMYQIANFWELNFHC